jgi:hypothetical protein
MSTRHLVWAAVIVGWVGIAQPADAHRLDEYLQATRIAVGQERIDLEVDLTAGANIATQISASIDTNGDGEIGSSERDDYARRVIDAVRMSVDGRALPVTLVWHEFPDRQSMALGVGTIRLRATADVSAGIGRHELAFLNGHAAASSVYLVNALLPSDQRIQISSQRRDVAQRGVTLDYSVAPGDVWVRGGWIATAVAMIGILRRRRS